MKNFFLWNSMFYFLILINIILLLKLKMLTILFLINLIFTEKNLNPLNLNIMIIITTIFLSMLMNENLKTNWFSLILFIVMIGGMMILFLYFNSFLIKEEFKAINLKMYLNNFFKLTFFSMLMIFLYNKLSLSMMVMNLNKKLLFLKFFINENILMFILNNKIYLSFLILIIFLLFCLMVITSLCMNKNISLRKFN
uniref:NADH dehydrogenase subunit 6 n=1 Tax=Idris sp. MM-2013 TaxID=1429433 RepID=A0A067YFY8_9HYME|nr:NADH dehydrogenase subunit 6 [Idris sp. MM-2013]